MSGRRRRNLAAAASGVVLAGWWMIMAPFVSAQGGVSGHYEGEGHTLDYSLSGVETDSENQPFRHSGTVVATQVTLTGTATFTIGEGAVTNLSMSASLWAGGESASDSWPPEGVDGRVGGVTIEFPFSLSIDIPPPPKDDENFFPTTTIRGAPPEPYTTLSFNVDSSNCNDFGVCGGPSARGTFAVFALPSKGPSVDWIAVAGALGSAAAAAAAVAGLLGLGGQSGDADSDRRIRYVLQVANDRLAVDATVGASLDVDVWAVDSTGATMSAVDAVVNATVAGPFLLASAAGAGSLHAPVSATGPPGSAGSVLVSATAGGMEMTTTVVLDCVGDHQLVVTPVGESVLRPDPASGDYHPAEFDLSVVTMSGQATLPVECVMTGAEAIPEGLVSLSQAPSPGATPGIRLAVDLAVDPALLVDPENRSVTVNVWMEPASIDNPTTLTASMTVQLVPPAATLHWMQSGHPETTGSTITCPAEKGSTIELEVWLETTDGGEPPQAEFSHMANVDLAGNQMAPTKVEFSCDPSSRPWQQPASDNRAHSLWLVNESLPTRSRPSLVPPVDTAIRVRAWPAGSMTRREESIDPTEGRLAQGLVPIRLTPSEVTCELVEPADPIPANDNDYQLTVRVLSKRSRQPWSGPIHFEVKDAEGRTKSKLHQSDFEIEPESDGAVELTVTTPDLQYRRDTVYQETLAVSAPSEHGEPWPLGEVSFWLAPALSLTVVSTKRGLKFVDSTIEFEAADRVDTIVGWTRCETTKTAPAEEHDDADVNEATISLVGPRESKEHPIVTGNTDESGRWELRLPGLHNPEDGEAEELDDDSTPAGIFDDELEDRLRLYEQRVSPRITKARHPLGDLAGEPRSDQIEDWRFATLQSLAAQPEDRYDDVANAIEIAELAGVFTCSFGTLYYDTAGNAVDTIGALLGDLMSFVFTLGDVGSKLASGIGSTFKAVSPTLDKYILEPALATARSALARMIRLLRRIASETGLGAGPLKEALQALEELWSSLMGAKSTEDMLVHGVEMVLNGIKALLNAAYSVILQFARELPPVISKAAEDLARALGAHLSPGWAKLCEDQLKQIIDSFDTTNRVGGAAGRVTAARLDPFPRNAGQSMATVLAALESLKIPTDPQAKRDGVKQTYQGLSRNAFDNQIMAAKADEMVAVLGLIITAIQIALIAWCAYKHLIGAALEKLTGQLNKLDYISTALSGMVHLVELFSAWWIAASVATVGTGAVAGAVE